MTSSFRFTVPGQPPSLNHIHKTVWRTDGAGNRYKGRAKEEEVTNYQLVAANECRRARHDWQPPQVFNPRKGHGLIVIRYWFYLARALDVDNAMKVLNDPIKHAIEIDDSHFLPQAWGRETGHKRDARVEVEVIAA